MASEAHCCFAFAALCGRLLKTNVAPLAHYKALAGVDGSEIKDDMACPLFVTYNTIEKDGERRLRGCIGTFASSPLESTLKRYAVVALV